MLPNSIPSTSPSDKELFYSHLYKTYYSVMKRVAFEVVNGGVNTDDIVQETLVRLLKQYGKLRIKTESALAFYVALTTKAVAIDALRQKYRSAGRTYYGVEDDFAGNLCPA